MDDQAKSLAEQLATQSINFMKSQKDSMIYSPIEKDNVNHPKHYTAHKSGVECIQITEHMNFNLGNAVKYVWRADEKGEAIEDLKKAAWYINREIEKRSKHGV